MVLLLEGVSGAERPACPFLELSEGCAVRESTTVEYADPKVEDRCREIKYVTPLERLCCVPCVMRLTILGSEYAKANGGTTADAR